MRPRFIFCRSCNGKGSSFFRDRKLVIAGNFLTGVLRTPLEIAKTVSRHFGAELEVVSNYVPFAWSESGELLPDSVLGQVDHVSLWYVYKMFF